MGAGCYYTHNATKTKAAWIDLKLPTEDDYERQDAFNWVLEDLEQILTDAGYYKDTDQKYHNGQYELFLEPTYYGDGLIIRIEPKDIDRWYGRNTYALAFANHSRTENKVLKLISKAGYDLYKATSGYTYDAIKFR
jgi:hypothetical protein